MLPRLVFASLIIVRQWRAIQPCKNVNLSPSDTLTMALQKDKGSSSSLSGGSIAKRKTLNLYGKSSSPGFSIISAQDLHNENNSCAFVLSRFYHYRKKSEKYSFFN
jgi:hypothetical protein